MPVRPYHRVRVGKNTGVIVTAGKRQRAGCLNILYWITIGWVLAPTWWLLKNGWALFVRLLNHLSGQIGKSMNTKSGAKSQKTVFYAFIALFIGVVCISCIVGLLSLSSGDQEATPTQEITPIERNEEIIIPTSTPEQTQTATIQPSNTFEPSKTALPSKTRTIIQSAAPTNTLRPVPTKTKSPTANAPCSCSSNYNCSNFSTHSQAQRCFDYCGGSKTNNFSGLDRDHDGIACETLP